MKKDTTFRIAILLSSVATLVIRLQQERRLQELEHTVAKLKSTPSHHIHAPSPHTPAALQDQVDLLNTLNTSAHGKLKHDALEAMQDHELMFHTVNPKATRRVPDEDELMFQLKLHSVETATQRAADEHESEPEQPDDLPKPATKLYQKTCGDLGTKMVVDRASGGQDSWLCGYTAGHVGKHGALRSNGTPHREWFGEVGQTYHHTIRKTTQWPYRRVRA